MVIQAMVGKNREVKKLIGKKKLKLELAKWVAKKPRVTSMSKLSPHFSIGFAELVGGLTEALLCFNYILIASTCI